MDINRKKNNTEIAILLDDYVNKYHPGVQAFKLQVTGGMLVNSRALYTDSITVPNLMNADTKNIKFNKIQHTSVVKLALPREVSRNYYRKYIPAGTRFIVQFVSGDITKPQIIGIEK